MERIYRVILLSLLSSGIAIGAMEGDSQGKDEVSQAHAKQETPYDSFQYMGLSLLSLIGLAPANWGDYRRRPNKWDIVAASMKREEKEE